MSWGVIFRIRQYAKGSLWFFPLIDAILGPLAALIVHQADAPAVLLAGRSRRPSQNQCWAAWCSGSSAWHCADAVHRQRSAQDRAQRRRDPEPGCRPRDREDAHLRSELGDGFAGGPIFPARLIGGTTGALVHQVFPGVPLRLAFTCLLAAVPGGLVAAPFSIGAGAGRFPADCLGGGTAGL
jgi:hypothetical protein